MSLLIFSIFLIGKDRRSKGGEEDDGGFGEHRVCSLGSTPDIPSAAENQSRSNHNRFTYCSPSELSHSVSQRSDHSRTPNSHHHSNRAQRHRKMRDYDSDTGYRSNHELMKFRQQQEQMFERLEISKGDNYCEIVPVASRLRKRDGYSSDLEGYSQRSSGVAYRDVPDNQVKNSNTHGLPNALNQSHNQSRHENSPHRPHTVHNDKREQTVSSSQPVRYPPSPSPFHRNRIVDQSTPMTPKSLGIETSVNRSQGSLDKHSEDLYLASDHRESDSPADSQNRYMVRHHTTVS